jgi:hypothetical protein
MLALNAIPLLANFSGTWFLSAIGALAIYLPAIFFDNNDRHEQIFHLRDHRHPADFGSSWMRMGGGSSSGSGSRQHLEFAHRRWRRQLGRRFGRRRPQMKRKHDRAPSAPTCWPT